VRAELGRVANALRTTRSTLFRQQWIGFSEAGAKRKSPKAQYELRLCITEKVFFHANENCSCKFATTAEYVHGDFGC
jgi:hypothetical protein